MKRIYFESAEGSSCRGFELSGVQCKSKSNDIGNYILDTEDTLIQISTRCHKFAKFISKDLDHEFLSDYEGNKIK